MRFYRRVLFVVVFRRYRRAARARPHRLSQVTCGAFLASGQTNMAAAIM